MGAGAKTVRIRSPKLPKEAVQSLRRVRLDVVAPFETLMAPVYVYLPKNGKFVAIKLPLQHFSPAELEKYKPYENFYLPEFIDQLAPFQRAGEAVRNVLEMTERKVIRTNDGKGYVNLAIAQHELDDAVLEIVSRLWNSNVRIEPFFLCFFANEVCVPLTPQTITEAVETNTDLFETGLLRASAGVFLALHIGYCEPRVLSRIYEKFFWDTMNGVRPTRALTEVSLIQRLVWTALPDASTKDISIDAIYELLWRDGTGGKASRKLISRLERVRAEFLNPKVEPRSLFGERGICDE